MGHHNHRTRRTVDCGALGDTLFVAQCLDTTPVIRRYLRDVGKSTTDHAKHVRGTYSDNRHSTNLVVGRYCMGNVLGVVAHGCVEQRYGYHSPDGCFECRLRRPCRAYQAPARCRQRSRCELNHKLTTYQLPRTNRGRDRGNTPKLPTCFVGELAGNLATSLPKPVSSHCGEC